MGNMILILKLPSKSECVRTFQSFENSEISAMGIGTQPNSHLGHQNSTPQNVSRLVVSLSWTSSGGWVGFGFRILQKKKRHHLMMDPLSELPLASLCRFLNPGRVPLDPPSHLLDSLHHSWIPDRCPLEYSTTLWTFGPHPRVPKHPYVDPSAPHPWILQPSHLDPPALTPGPHPWIPQP